jgi:beta-mannanase
MRLVLLLASVPLAACVSQAQIDRQVAAIPSQCRAEGFKDGTEAFAMCQQAKASMVSTSVAYEQARAQRMQQAFAGMAAAGAAAQPPRPITCQSMRGFNGSYTTQCY